MKKIQKKPRKKNKLGDIVYIKFLDHYTQSTGWTSSERLKTIQPFLCECVGFFVSEDKTSLKLSLLASEENISFSDTFVALKSTIVTRGTLVSR